MRQLNAWKQLKKKLRRIRGGALSLGAYVTVITLSLLLAGSQASAQSIYLRQPSTSHNRVIKLLEEHRGPLKVKLQRTYICGEEIKLLGQLSPQSIIGMLQEHPGWTAAVDKDEETVLLQEEVNDLSEACRSHAYFGMDQEGMLKLFEGVPRKEKVIRTFFQLDVQFMESSLPKGQVDELVEGIHVKDMDEYNSVLSTFSDYAMERNEKAMKPAY
ncbi:BofC C-terminal domain-containing protein [Paenibacillus sp. GCM10023252]|uniref:BofC C-terminal domain-containing protein n=1 Tax=Paenibacillus sp. GCM10023252 TaxID=3252649 RepID=UPI00360E9527